MRAMVLHQPREPLRLETRPIPRPDAGIVDGDLPAVKPATVPGHEIVAEVEAVGEGVSGFGEGQRVGLPWLGYACGVCEFCRGGEENLCDKARFTGYQIDGGFADYALADAGGASAFPFRKVTPMSMPLPCYVRGWSASGHWEWRETGSAWAFTVSARPPTLSRKSRFTRDATSMLSRARVMKRRSRLLARLVASGPAPPETDPMLISTQP